MALSLALFATVASPCAAPGSAAALTATATLTAGTLAFASTPPPLSFSGTLTGLDQTLSSSQPLDVGDTSGSGVGWNISATSTIFETAGGRTLPANAITITSAPSAACDASSSCILASNSVTYAYTLPAGVTAPPATEIFNAGANSGMGNQTVTPTWKLAVPSVAYAGTYSSTWTISLLSGP